VNAHLVGTGMTPFGFAPVSAVRSLAAAAVDEASGVGRADLDVVEVHDSAAPAERWRW
jgi:hypothetical protein